MSTTTEVMAEIMPVLNSIGEKLGVASAHLWEVMVRQAFVNGVFFGILSILMLLVLCVFYKASKFCWGKHEGSRIENKHYGGDWLLGVFIPMFLSIIVFALFASFLKDSITGLLNPEYAAFTDITDRLAGHKR